MTNMAAVIIVSVVTNWGVVRIHTPNYAYDYDDPSYGRYQYGEVHEVHTMHTEYNGKKTHVIIRDKKLRDVERSGFLKMQWEAVTEKKKRSRKPWLTDGR